MVQLDAALPGHCGFGVLGHQREALTVTINACDIADRRL